MCLLQILSSEHGFRCHLGIIHALWATFAAGMERRLRVLWSTSSRRWRIRLWNICVERGVTCERTRPHPVLWITGGGSCSRIGAWSKGQGQGTSAGNQQSRARGAVVRAHFVTPRHQNGSHASWRERERECKGKYCGIRHFCKHGQWQVCKTCLFWRSYNVGACWGCMYIYIWWPWHLQITPLSTISCDNMYMPLHLNHILFCQANVISKSLCILFSLPKFSFLMQSYVTKGHYINNPTNALS